MTNATERRDKGLFIPTRFQQRVALHLIENNAGAPGTPLIQLWHSRPGNGKTSGLEAILGALKARVFVFGSSRLESRDAGRPADEFLDVFEGALATLRGRRVPAPSAVLLHDPDQVLGKYGTHVQGTVNQPHFTAALMELCDRYARPGRHPRPAVYVTANRPELLHGPLTRDGRCETLRWEYEPCERELIVGRIFPHLGSYHAQCLVEQFPAEPIAFFAGLKRHARRTAALDHLRQVTAARAVDLAVTGRWRVPPVAPTLDELIALGEDVRSNRAGGDLSEAKA